MANEWENWQQMPTVNRVSMIYATGAPTLDVLQREAHQSLERLRAQIAEIKAASADARNKPPSDSRSRKYLRLWKAVYSTKLF